MTILPTKANWWYESIIDWMLMNPDRSKKDAAVFFKVTPSWMYQLTQSDVFKTLFEERRKLHNGMVSSSIIEKTEALTELALDKLTERVVSAGNEMTPQFLKETIETGLDRLGYSGRRAGTPIQGGPVTYNTQVNVVSSADLAAARARIAEHQARLQAMSHVDVETSKKIIESQNGHYSALDGFLQVIEHAAPVLPTSEPEGPPVNQGSGHEIDLSKEVNGYIPRDEK